MSDTTYFKDTKPHYKLLDSLRGVAALMVIWYHIFEGYAFAGALNGATDGSITTFNHGYLAVDFFFMLSGFVISYAYDNRWRSMGILQFFKRRLVRLHPMLIMGAIIGAAAFFVGGCTNWAGENIAPRFLFMALILAIFFIPAYGGAPYDVRGNGEMFPLNGPSWSLFFEYIGNILYAIFIRRLSTRWLKLFTAILGISFIIFATTNASGYGNIGVGWTLDTTNFFGGLLRMLFPFTLGMLLQRTQAIKYLKKPLPQRATFWICTIALFAIFSVPFLGAGSHFSLNGVYEVLCVMLFFPAIVTVAAASNDGDTGKLLGEISYPIYIIHYPIMYLFYEWLIDNKLYTLQQTWPMVVAVFGASLLIAYLCLKLYDIPIRRWLGAKL